MLDFYVWGLYRNIADGDCSANVLFELGLIRRFLQNVRVNIR